MQLKFRKRCKALAMRTISVNIITFCKIHGLRYPGKKLLVADYLQNLNDYTCVSKVYVALRNSGVKISPATVYQSIGWLIKNGFAESKADGDTSTRENKFRISCGSSQNSGV